MSRTVRPSIGFCSECRSPIFEESSRYQCLCGAVAKSSAYFSPAWNIPAGNITSMPHLLTEKSGDGKNLLTRAASNAG